MKKIIYLPIAAFVMILFTMQSCKKDSQIANGIDQKTYGYQVKNGRLVFDNIASYDSLKLVLSQKNTKELDTWENSIHYKSYRTFENEAIIKNWNSYLANDTVSSGVEINKNIIGLYSLLYNQNGEVQISDSISFFDGKKIYFVKYEGEKAFAKIKNEIITSNLKSASNNYRCIELKIDTLKRKTTTLKSISFNNSYQYEFQYVPTSTLYKFVEQCLRSSNMISVQIYMEYWRHRSWPNHNEWDYAGETVYKSYSLYITSSPKPIPQDPCPDNSSLFGTNWIVNSSTTEVVGGWMKEAFLGEELYESDSQLWK